MTTDRPKLTAKQAAFVSEYLIDLSATQAAIRAGYSVKTANRIASENLTKPVISRAIEQAMARRAERTELTAQDVLDSIIQIRGMAIETDKLSDALKANDLLGRHLGMWKDVGSKDNPLTGNVVLTLSKEDAAL